MAELAEQVEASPEVETQPEAVPALGANGNAAEADPEARFRYDEELLIKGKGGRVRRPTKPDEQERNLQFEKLKAEIEKRSTRIKEIKETVEASRSARNAGQSGNQEIIRRLQGLRQEFQTILRQKQHIREELQQAIKQKEDLRAASRQLRDKLPKGVTAETIDAKIAELEYKMAHESGEDDKVLFKRIQDFKQARPAYKEFGDIEAKLKACEERRAEIQHRLQQCDAVLTDVKAREEVERTTLETSRNKQAETDLDVPALNVEKKECWDIIQALRAKMDELRKDFQEKYMEYIKLDRNYNNYMRSVKRKEWQEREKARAERAAEENGVEVDPGANGSVPGAKDRDMPVAEAYAAEVLTLDQLLLHLRKLAPSDEKAGVAQEEKKEVEVPKGMKLLKKDDSAEFMTVAKKKPAGKKGAPAPVAAPAPAAKAAEPAKKKLNHTLEALKTFMQFGIEVPQTTAELPATIEKAVAKKEYYLELRRTGKKHVPPAPLAARPAPAVEPEEAAEASTSGSNTAAAEPEPAPVTTPATSNGASSSNYARAAGAVEGDNGHVEAVAVVAKVPVLAAESAASADSSAPLDGLGMTLAVDKLTESVSIKLRYSETA